ncbi:N-acetyltransferase family protein [Rhodopila sp.]|uniref:GNAT family N-acetyltransferase n=1 Tax=Rhodopila sp. TaxID=2480087 RepID=UPI003D115F7A
MMDSLPGETVADLATDLPEIAVRAPTGSDIRALADLFAEMQRHYRRPVSHQQAIEAATLACQPVRATFDPRVLLAEVAGAIAGSIVLNVTFPAFELSRALYIRDLYVRQSMRRLGVGQALVKAAARLTYSQTFSALDWTTETGNAAARQMYESCGARVLARTYYRLALEDLNGKTEWLRDGITAPDGSVLDRKHDACRHQRE